MHVKIVSQTNSIYEGECFSVTLPGKEGILTLLDNHEPLIIELTVGEVTIRKEQENDIVFISGGLMTVDRTGCLVLADEAQLPQEAILDDIEQAIKAAQHSVSVTTDVKMLVQLEKQLRYHFLIKDRISR